MKENYNNVVAIYSVGIHCFLVLLLSSSLCVCVSVSSLTSLLCYFCPFNIFSSKAIAIVMKTSANVTFLRWFCWMKDTRTHTLKGRERERENACCCWFGRHGIYSYIHSCRIISDIIIIVVVLQNAVEKRIFHHTFVVCIEIKFLLKPYLGACAFGGFCIWFFFLISCNDRQFQTNS